MYFRPGKEQPPDVLFYQKNGAPVTRPQPFACTSTPERMQSSFMDKTRKAVVTGVVSAGIASMMGSGGYTDALGVELPVPVAIGASNAVASVAADLSLEYVLPHIPGNDKYSYLESAALGLGVAGAGTAYILNREQLGSYTTMNAALLGAAAYAGGDYIDSKFFGGNPAVRYY